MSDVSMQVALLSAPSVWMGINFASSIGIVALNKQAYWHGIPSTSLTFCHFVVTSVALQARSTSNIPI